MAADIRSEEGLKSNLLQEYMKNTKVQLEASLDTKSLLNLSHLLQIEYQNKLRNSPCSMLPSYHHTLPTGYEKGIFLALDLGGSTLRIQFVDLSGHPGSSDGTNNHVRIRSIPDIDITQAVRETRGLAFFDWLVDQIATILNTQDVYRNMLAVGEVIPMGLSWSFPIEQTSIRTGNLIAMGKGFAATNGLEGQDLYTIFTNACKARGLKVDLRAVINDSIATLLSSAYVDPSVNISLILGTGINSAIYLPCQAVSPKKLPISRNCEEKVIVNTELSMFGNDVWPLTRWDEQLKCALERPDYQPLEYLVGGRYLGEVARLILMDLCTSGLLHMDDLPKGLDHPYTFHTSMLATIEGDANVDPFDVGNTVFGKAGNFKWVNIILPLLRQVAHLLSSRAAAFVAVSLHALCEIRQKYESKLLDTKADQPDNKSQTSHARPENNGLSSKLTIACTGAVIERYPKFMERCQAVLDQMLTANGMNDKIEIAKSHLELKAAHQDSLWGAAVAAALNHADD